MPGLLDQLRLAHGSVSVEGTPRRLAVTIADLAPRQPDAEDKLRGPPAKVVCTAALASMWPVTALALIKLQSL